MKIENEPRNIFIQQIVHGKCVNKHDSRAAKETIQAKKQTKRNILNVSIQ